MRGRDGTRDDGGGLPRHHWQTSRKGHENVVVKKLLTGLHFCYVVNMTGQGSPRTIDKTCCDGQDVSFTGLAFQLRRVEPGRQGARDAPRSSYCILGR